MARFPTPRVLIAAGAAAAVAAAAAARRRNAQADATQLWRDATADASK